EPRLDGVTDETDVLLPELDRPALGDLDLQPHQVETGDLLGDGMFDLEARVHLEEVELAVRCEDELDGPGSDVADGPGCPTRRRAQTLAQPGIDPGRRRLLDHLLVAALDRALALAQVDDCAVRVAEHLDLDVSRALDVALHQQRVVPERAERLAASRRQRAGESLLAL